MSATHPVNSSPAVSLGQLPLLAKFGLTAALVVVSLGFWASISHIENSHAKNDGDAAGLSLDDVVGHYHGIDIPSPLKAVLAGEVSGHPEFELSAAEGAALDDWLAGDRLSDDFDSIDLGDMAPVEILAVACGDCHFGDDTDRTGGGVGLEYWEDLKPLLSDKVVTPVSFKLLVTSMHTHALSMGVIVILLGLLATMTRFGGFLRGLPMFLGGIGLLADVGGWLLARGDAMFVYGILAGGALYTAGCGLAVLLVLADIWLPRGNRSES